MFYIYGLGGLLPEAQKALLYTVDACGDSICKIDEDDLEKTVEECLNSKEAIVLSSFKPEANKEESPFLLMDIDDLEIDLFLSEMRKNKVRIPHKCMVTKKNKAWKLKKLISDVQEEHQIMTRIIKLQQLITSTDSLKEEEYDAIFWLSFVEMRNRAQDLIKHVGKVEIAVDVVQAVITQLQEALSMLEANKKA